MKDREGLKRLKQAIDEWVSHRFAELRLSYEVGGRIMTQAEFGELTGVARTTIVSIENGKQGATLTTLYQVAASLNLSLAQLLPPVEEIMQPATPNATEEERLAKELGEWSELLELEAQPLTTTSTR